MVKTRGAKSKTFHGRLSIGSNHICFYSRIFGYIYKVRAVSSLTELSESYPFARHHQTQAVNARERGEDKNISLWEEGNTSDHRSPPQYLFHSFEKDSEVLEAYKVIDNIYDAKNERKAELEDPSKVDGDSSDDNTSTTRTRTR